MEYADEYRYGCLFCMTGDEKRIVQEIRRLGGSVDALFPKKVRLRRFEGQTREETVPIFPGYVFFRLLRGEKVIFPHNWHLNAKMLTYGDGSWQLRGADEAIAKTFFEVDGVIKLSTAYYEGDRVRILDGFLKRYEGSIIRVNHRAKTAEIRMTFQDKILSCWLGFELFEKVKAEQR